MMTTADNAKPDPHDDAGHPAHLAHHFDTPQQQFQAGKLGMWIFLLTEILLFGGLFCAYAVYRANHPGIFSYAAEFLDTRLGAVNTCILITSSLTMAWGVRCAQRNQQQGLVLCLALTLLFAFGFLGVKYVEYKHKWEGHLLWASKYDPHEHVLEEAEGHRPRDADSGGTDQQARENAGVFFSIYFMMTGLHAVHVLGGMIAISWLLVRAGRGTFSSQYFAPVDYVGLYWHLVDMIWIYLFPLLYLIH